ncbi:MAG: 4Fe-4S binding protein [bacterium]
MPLRKIIEIDEEKCDGCALCVDACHEGAIQIVGGVAKLVSEIYCDGLGDCLGECPQGAITIDEREAKPFDEKAVATHLARQRDVKKLAMAPAVHHPHVGGCPGAAMRQLTPAVQSEPGGPAADAGPSALTNWPVQLHLVPVQAPYFDRAKVLIAADCVPFAQPGFHQNMLQGRTLIIGCPKLDDVSAYLDKLTAIFKFNDIQSVEVAFMEVPCCHGLVRLVQQALEASGKDLQPSLTRVGIRGEIQAA